MENRALRFLQMIFLMLQVLGSHAAVRTQPFPGSGIERDAWPEFTGKDGNEALEAIKQSGVENVFIQPPTSVEDTPFIHGGTVDDVWLYTDASGLVLGIPRRGDWHPNRLLPGWVELKGVNYKEAIQRILAEDTGVKVLYGPKGTVYTDECDTRRVILIVGADGKVAEIPHLE